MMKTLFGLILGAGILLSACGRITEVVPRGYLEATPEMHAPLAAHQSWLCGDGGVAGQFYICRNPMGDPDPVGFMNTFAFESANVNPTAASSVVRIIIALDIPGETPWVPQGWTDATVADTTLSWTGLFPLTINLTGAKHFGLSGPDGILLLTESNKVQNLGTASVTYNGTVPNCYIPNNGGQCTQAGVGHYWRRSLRGGLFENLDPECNKTTPEAFCNLDVSVNGVPVSTITGEPNYQTAMATGSLGSLNSPFSVNSGAIATTVDATSALNALRAKYNSGAHQYKAMYLVARRGIFTYLRK